MDSNNFYASYSGHKGYSSEIVITFAFLLSTKCMKKYILWHEYGHHILHIDKIPYEDNKSTLIDEAITDFYACCKCKIHFNSWCEMRLNKFGRLKPKSNKENYCELYEQRNNVEKNDLTLLDSIYQFYRDINKLFLCYNELFKKYGYRKKFNWNNLLNEIGWSKDKDRWEYISYNNQN
jgi:uncharacterized protein YlbG (UPF0298 family)